MSRRFRSIPPAWPSEVLFFLTHRCNLRCSMCGQWSEHGYARDRIAEFVAEELGAERYTATLDELARFKPNVILCGGEVLLYPQWREFVAMLAERHLPFTLITNGTRLEGAAERLVASGLGQVSVSIDGPRPVHDRIRGREGTYDAAVSGIRAVLAARGAAARPAVSLNTTITKEGWESLPDVLDAAEEIGLDAVTFLHPNFLDEGLYHDHERVFAKLVGGLSSGWDGFVQDFDGFDASGLARVVSAVKGRAKGRTAATFLPDFTSAEIVAYYRNGVFTSDRLPAGCRGPINTVNVHPNGAVSPCLGYAVGNITETSFGAIWRGERMASFRRLVERDLAFPACSRCCTYYRF